jgi:hypothetical protein
MRDGIGIGLVAIGYASALIFGVWALILVCWRSSVNCGFRKF